MPRLPKNLIKKYGISKEAWRIFRGKGRKRSKTKSGGKSMARRRTRRYYPRRRRGGGGKSLIKTLFKLVRIGAALTPAIKGFTEYGMNKHGVSATIAGYTGYNFTTNEWKWEWLVEGWKPYIMAALITYGIPKITGIIRKI